LGRAALCAARFGVICQSKKTNYFLFFFAAFLVDFFFAGILSPHYAQVFGNNNVSHFKTLLEKLFFRSIRRNLRDFGFIEAPRVPTFLLGAKTSTKKTAALKQRRSAPAGFPPFCLCGFRLKPNELPYYHQRKPRALALGAS